jgi:hypothetical protein
LARAILSSYITPENKLEIFHKDNKYSVAFLKSRAPS